MQTILTPLFFMLTFYSVCQGLIFDLGKISDMIIFESLLTTCELAINVKILLETKFKVTRERFA